MKNENSFLDLPTYSTPLYDFLHGENGVAHNGNNIINIDTCTPVDLYAKVDGEKNPHRGNVFKHTIGIAVQAATYTNINAYKAAQQRNLETAGHTVEFKEKRESYYISVNRDTCIQLLKSNNDKEYFRCIYPKQQGVETYYTYNGEVIAYDDIKGKKPVKEPYIIPESKGKGTEHHVVSVPARNILTHNITGMRAGKASYIPKPIAE